MLPFFCKWSDTNPPTRINLLKILVETLLPAFAKDVHDIILRIFAAVGDRNQDVPISDGLELYEHLKQVRAVYQQAIPRYVSSLCTRSFDMANQPFRSEFPWSVEDLLAEFVWRLISGMETQVIGWVDEAIKHDNFIVRLDENHPNQSPDDHHRHSVSIIDVIRSFNDIVAQIKNLDWEDEFQYAKFMTAVSKSLGAGLSHYCDVLESLFSREMDRPTPEQEALALKTKQEKWMQMAKDAWANRDKVEPFNFFPTVSSPSSAVHPATDVRPQSFVKLNDIEFAIVQWDQLEKAVNVDGCAEVIERYEPRAAQKYKKRVQTYVFTIKIVEGEDLKACDINGYSDPYVVLGDELGKRLAKTRIIYANLNPRWDETIDITTQGPLNIVATVWDWDTLGEHDCVGRTTLKLDPSHFSDYMPREYRLPLDTQGNLLLRVSMEGERDDIQFYFGKTFRTLKRTERDMARQITDKVR